MPESVEGSKEFYWMEGCSSAVRHRVRAIKNKAKVGNNVQPLDPGTQLVTPAEKKKKKDRGQKIRIPDTDKTNAKGAGAPVNRGLDILVPEGLKLNGHE